MKVVEINSVDYGSTGKIMLGIQKVCEEQGIECYCFSGKYKNNKTPKNDRCFYFGSYFSYAFSYLAGLYTGYESCFSYFATKSLLRKVSKIKPDIIHLHNLHGSYINYQVLFKYIKKHNIKTVWTLHDCWSFTGRCPCFQITKCEHWKGGCQHCSYPKHEYPKCKISQEKWLWKLKKECFVGVKDLTIVTPSKWLANLVSQSYLHNYPVKVIHNGVDTDIFKPVLSDFRDTFGLQNKIIVLGVANVWTNRKGLDVFCRLASDLNDSYQIVLVGVDESLKKTLPANILSISRTNNQEELAQIYSAADVFLNPTREDNYPTVNLEAIACGTPVITFDVGGCAETVKYTENSIVLTEEYDKLFDTLIHYSYSTLSNTELFNVIKINQTEKFLEYVKLYDNYYR